MPAILRPVLARVIGALVAGLAAWLTGRYGFELDADARGQLTEGIVVALLMVYSVVYAIVHKTVGAYTNPADVASPTLAKATTDPVPLSPRR